MRMRRLEINARGLFSDADRQGDFLSNSSRNVCDNLFAIKAACLPQGAAGAELRERQSCVGSLSSVLVCVGLVVVLMRDWAIIFGLTLRPSLRYYRVRQVVVDGGLGLGWDVLTWPSLSTRVHNRRHRN